MTTRTIILFGLMLCCYSMSGIQHTKTMVQPEVKEQSKFKKKLEKFSKKLEKLHLNSEGLLKKPQPWLALGLALGGLGLMIFGIAASFGLLPSAAALGFIGGFVLSALGFILAISSFRNRKESKSPKLTAVVSIIAIVISSCISLIGLIGIINAITNS